MYCNANIVGILGFGVFQQILSIFTLEHENPLKTAVFITYVRKLCISKYCNDKRVEILGLRVFQQILSIFTSEHEKSMQNDRFHCFYT